MLRVRGGTCFLPSGSAWSIQDKRYLHWIGFWRRNLRQCFACGEDSVAYVAKLGKALSDFLVQSVYVFLVYRLDSIYGRPSCGGFYLPNTTITPVVDNWIVNEPISLFAGSIRHLLKRIQLYHPLWVDGQQLH